MKQNNLTPKQINEAHATMVFIPGFVLMMFAALMSSLTLSVISTTLLILAVGILIKGKWKQK